MCIHLCSNLKQLEKESIDTYVQRLNSVIDGSLVEDAAMKNRIIKNAITTNTRHKELQQYIFRKGDALTLKQILKRAREIETGEVSRSLLSNAPATEHAFSVNANAVVSECDRCGYLHSADGRCRATGQECSKCGLKGHFQSKCKTPGYKWRKPHLSERDNSSKSGSWHKNRRNRSQKRFKNRNYDNTKGQNSSINHNKRHQSTNSQ